MPTYVNWKSIKGKASGVDTLENFNNWSRHESARGKYAITKRFDSANPPEGYKPPVSKEQLREQKAAAKNEAIKKIQEQRKERSENRKAANAEREARRAANKTESPKAEVPVVSAPPEALSAKQPGNQPEQPKHEPANKEGKQEATGKE